MPRSAKKASRCHLVVPLLPLEVVLVQHVDDQVLDDDDVARIEALGDGLRLVLGEVGVDDVAQVVDRRAVLLLRHPPVVGPHAALDVNDRDVQLRGGEAADDGVRVPEEDGRHRLHLVQHRVETADHLGGDFGVGLAARAELEVGRRDVQLAEEDVLEVVRVVLAGPDEAQVDVLEGP